MKRVFGTLCFPFDKDEAHKKKTDGHTGDSKWKVGVMLGIDNFSTSWRVGTFVQDGRVRYGRWGAGWRWTVLRNSTVRVCETVVVENCEDLMLTN